MMENQSHTVKYTQDFLFLLIIVLMEGEKKMNKREAYKIVLDDLLKCNLFCGIYDRENGSEEFMQGISTIMEYLVYEVYGVAGINSFSEMFFNNMEGGKDEVL